MWTFIQLVGALVFLFFVCYLVAAMGNHGRYVQRHENDLGCAIIMFAALMIYFLFSLLGR